MKKYMRESRIFFPKKIPSLAPQRIVLSICLLDPFDDKWLHFSWWNFEYAICPPPKWRWARVWRRQEGDETSIMESILLIENAHDKVWRNNVRRTMLLGGFFFFLKKRGVLYNTTLSSLYRKIFLVSQISLYDKDKGKWVWLLSKII